MPLSDKLTDRKVIIYPNPTQGCLMIQITGGDVTDCTLCHVYDMQGTLLTQTKAESAGMHYIDLPAFPTGNYILRLQTGENTVD